MTELKFDVFCHSEESFEDKLLASLVLRLEDLQNLARYGDTIFLENQKMNPKGEISLEIVFFPKVRREQKLPIPQIPKPNIRAVSIYLRLLSSPKDISATVRRRKNAIHEKVYHHNGHRYTHSYFTFITFCSHCKVKQTILRR